TLSPLEDAAATGAYRGGEREDVSRGCFELLLIRAEVLARPPDEPARLSEALAALDRAERLLPGTEIARRRRAQCLRRLGRADDVRDAAAGPAPATPAAALDDYLLGRDALLDEHDPAAALRHFDSATGQDPGLFWAHFLRALACDQLRDRNEAWRSLSACETQRRDFVWTYLVRGLVDIELADRATGAERDRALAAAAADLARAERLKGDEPGSGLLYELHVG